MFNQSAAAAELVACSDATEVEREVAEARGGRVGVQ